MKSKFLILIPFFLLCACKEKNTHGQKNNVKDAIPMNHSFVNDYNNKSKIENLCKKILIEGDTIAFRELRYIYMVSEHSEEFLYFSTFMAEKYNYGPAFQTNYDILKDYKQSTMQRLAIYNLVKSYELGNRNDIQELNELFPKGIPKSVEYWNR
jgi:hypothetical protein